MNYFACRLPRESDIVKGAAKKILPEIKEGFFFSPFALDASLTTIPRERDFTDDEATEWSRENDEEFSGATDILSLSSTPRLRHMATVDEIINQIKKWESETGENGKIIAARISVEDCHKTPMELFRDLTEKWSEAFVFLFSTPHTGTWIGASPELLLHVDKEAIKTMSLAGTRLRGVRAEWDDKNLKEQAIVTRFILERLEAEGFEASPAPLVTLEAGKVEHLCTCISAPVPIDKDMSAAASSVIRSLSPTPALSGYPREEAMDFIRHFEWGERLYYGGAVGIASQERIDAYVNLRSGLFMTNLGKIHLYAGGGIGSSSVAEDEWTETENKLSTMRDVLTDLPSSLKEMS